MNRKLKAYRERKRILEVLGLDEAPSAPLKNETTPICQALSDKWGHLFIFCKC